MPEFRITAPDGRKFRVKAPEGATKDQALERVRRQYQQPSDDKSFLQSASDAITGAGRTTDEIESISEIGAAPELNELSVPAFKASLGLLTTGDTKSLQGILASQFGDKVQFRNDEKGNTIVALPSGEYALNKPGMSGQDIVRGAFDLASFTPAARAGSLLGAGARAAGTEALIEGAESSTGGEFTPKEVAGAGAFGVGGKAAENIIGSAYRLAKGSAADDVIEAGVRSKIKVQTSDVRQPKTFAGKILQQTAEKIPVAGTGAMRESQQKLRDQAVSDFAGKYGEFSYDAIVNSLKSKKDRIKSAAGNVLQNTGDKLDSIGQIPMDNTVTAMRRASEELLKPGVIASEGAIRDLQRLTDALFESPQSFTTLKENRTLFREIAEGADKAERSQLTSRAKSLLKSVENAMRRDMDSFARDNLSPREYAKWQRANTVYADEAKNLTKTRLKSVLDKGDVAPENVKGLLFSQKPSEVRLLYRSLGDEGKRNARTAIVNKVVGDLGRRQAGITPNSFASEMKKYGLQTDTFFKGEEKKALRGLLKALDATRRAQDAAVTTPTGQQLLGAFGVTGIAIDPMTTVGAAGTVGALARLYESPAVRDALLRLGSIPKGSSKFEQALLDLQTALTAGAQAARSE